MNSTLFDFYITDKDQNYFLNELNFSSFNYTVNFTLSTMDTDGNVLKFTSKFLTGYTQIILAFNPNDTNDAIFHI